MASGWRCRFRRAHCDREEPAPRLPHHGAGRCDHAQRHDGVRESASPSRPRLPDPHIGICTTTPAAARWRLVLGASGATSCSGQGGGRGSRLTSRGIKASTIRDTTTTSNNWNWRQRQRWEFSGLPQPPRIGTSTITLATALWRLCWVRAAPRPWLGPRDGQALDRLRARDPKHHHPRHDHHLEQLERRQRQRSRSSSGRAASSSYPEAFAIREDHQVPGRQSRSRSSITWCSYADAVLGAWTITGAARITANDGARWQDVHRRAFGGETIKMAEDWV